MQNIMTYQYKDGNIMTVCVTSRSKIRPRNRWQRRLFSKICPLVQNVHALFLFLVYKKHPKKKHVTYAIKRNPRALGRSTFFSPLGTAVTGPTLNVCVFTAALIIQAVTWLGFKQEEARRAGKHSTHLSDIHLKKHG